MTFPECVGFRNETYLHRGIGGLEVLLIIGPADHVTQSIHQPNLVFWAFLMQMLGLEITVHHHQPGIFPTIVRGR